MTFGRPAAAVMAAVVAAAGFPSEAAAQIARPGVVRAGTLAPAAPIAAVAPVMTPDPRLAPAAGVFAGPAVLSAPSVTLFASALPQPAAAAAPAPSPAAASVSGGQAAALPAFAAPVSGVAAAPAVERETSASGALFDGALSAAADGPDGSVESARSAAVAPRAPGLSMRPRTPRRLGSASRSSGLLARAGGFAARVTGISALWGLYRDGVLVQRYAQRLSDPAAHELRRTGAARMLASLGKVDAVPVLGRAAESDESPRVRRSARAALVFLADTAGPGLIRTLKFSPFSVSRETAAVGLGWIARHAEAPAAVEALGSSGLIDPSETVRLAAIDALSSARSPKASATLSWMRGVEKRPSAVAALDRALASAAERQTSEGRGHLLPPAEHLSFAARPLHAAALRSSIIVGLTFAAAEFAGGLATGTLALRADALHLAGDRVLDAAALLAMFIARRPPTSRKTYGWLKAEAVFSFVGALAIAAMGFGMIPDVYEGFVHPVAAHGWSVLGFAALSIVSNLISAAMLHRHQGEHLGVRGAFLHALTDAVGTFGVMLAAAASLLFGWTFLMPLATSVLVAMVLRVSWELGRPAWDVLMDAVPAGVDLEKLETDLGALPGVAGVIDLHVRALNSMGAELSAKLYAREGADHSAILAGAGAFLRERYGIVHSTIQIETAPTSRP